MESRHAARIISVFIKMSFLAHGAFIRTFLNLLFVVVLDEIETDVILVVVDDLRLFADAKFYAGKELAVHADIGL